MLSCTVIPYHPISNTQRFKSKSDPKSVMLAACSQDFPSFSSHERLFEPSHWTSHWNKWADEMELRFLQFCLHCYISAINASAWLWATTIQELSKLTKMVKIKGQILSEQAQLTSYRLPSTFQEGAMLDPSSFGVDLTHLACDWELKVCFTNIFRYSTLEKSVFSNCSN